MSSVSRPRRALTGRGEEAEVIGGVLFELKVAGPSMLGIGCPDRHPLPLIHSPPPPKMHPPRRRPPAGAAPLGSPDRPYPAGAQMGGVGEGFRMPARGDLSAGTEVRRPKAPQE